jgi:hypothetical protein
MAQIDISDIDELIKRSLAHANRLQELKRILSDSELVSTLNQVLASKNGNSPVSIQSISGEGKANKKGELLNKIKKVCEERGLESFTVQDIVKHYELAGYKFDAKDKAVSAYTALQRLVEKGVLEIAEEGKGSRPTKYQMAR